MRVLILLGGQVFSGAEITTLRFATALPNHWTVEVAAHPSVIERATAFGLHVHSWRNESAPDDTLLRASHFIDEPNPASQPGRDQLDNIISGFNPERVIACMFPVAMLALPVLQKHNIPLFVHHQLMYKDMPDHPITAPVRRVAEYAQCIIAASHAVNEPLKRANIHNVKVIPAGLPEGYGQLKAAVETPLRLLAIGTWGPQKGLETLLEADQLLRNENLEYALTIAGPLEAYSSDYETSIRSLAHESVCFIGNQPNPEPCYCNADILIVPSSEPDPYPTVTLEGMAHGLAVIATNCGGLSEQVIHGETGLLVSPKNTEEMTKALRQLITMPDLTLKMGRAGFNRRIKMANMNRRTERFIQLIHEPD